ncbi:MAG: hypothetical protein ACLP7P_04145 [Rhodomicrobium sp.]
MAETGFACRPIAPVRASCTSPAHRLREAAFAAVAIHNSIGDLAPGLLRSQ